MNDKEIFKTLTPVGVWLRSHLVYFGAFVSLFLGLGLWVIFNDVANAEASVWREFSEIARNLGLLLLGVIGLPLAIWRSVVASSQAKTAIRQSEHTAKQIELLQQGQLADRFTKAAAMLSDKMLPVREASIYALREIATADPEGYYFSVQDLLCSYMRHASNERNREASDQDYIEECPSDIATTLRSFSQMRTKENLEREKKRHWAPNLQEINISGFSGDAQGINFTNANLIRANLSDANLDQAIICNARAMGTNMSGANLRRAIVCDTRLFSANLARANFALSTLTKVGFFKADCREATFRGAKIERCSFTKSNICEATFLKANIIASQFDVEYAEGALFSPPIWPESDWPQGFHPSQVLLQESFGEDDEFFNFIPV
ncbi:pentapeptide repeat-containing protein [uncultured Cohaesibacter sp.]|uniref:pentapeptide repeat-containing protein n=1 Tax=uncultured Cohaesibacter sp. TaxID=1002546 RepID=UPI002AA81FCE|nr:pentapeptide repeat-containing protein [uncultured Cohaesibacter sp.]